MSFFQNVFDQDFLGVWTLSDKQYSLTFKIPQSRNHPELMASFNSGPYDLSGSNDTLTINFAIDRELRHYASLSIDVSGATAAATTAVEVVTALNADVTFFDRFEAFAEYSGRNDPNTLRVIIRARKPKTSQRAWISNTSAETQLQFNRYAGIAEAPIYFHRHTIANSHTYTNSQAMLIPLSHPIEGNTVDNPTEVTSPGHGLTTNDTVLFANSNSSPTLDGSRVVTVLDANTFTVPVNVTTAGTRGEWMTAYEQTMITDAGFTPADVKADWELVAGRSGLFTFQKITVDGSDRITQIIEYPAGAVAGDFGRLISYVYTGANTKPSEITEIPHHLLSGDLITPA